MFQWEFRKEPAGLLNSFFIFFNPFQRRLLVGLSKQMIFQKATKSSRPLFLKGNGSCITHQEAWEEQLNLIGYTFWLTRSRSWIMHIPKEYSSSLTTNKVKNCRASSFLLKWCVKSISKSNFRLSRKTSLHEN